MQKSHLEPGFLQVFRIYAWLRLATLLLILMAGVRFYFSQNVPFHTEFSSLADLRLPMFVMVINIVALLGGLYWQWLQNRLDRYYAPTIIIFATVGLIVEAHLFSIQKVFNMVSSFLFIPLILTAWQYDFRHVILYTFGTAALEISLFVLFPAPPMIASIYPDSDQIVYFALIGRSIAFLMLGYVVSRLVEAQREQRQALSSANQKLVQHAATLEQLATSRERIRLSRELHDTLAHTLSALTVQLEAVLTVWNDIPEKAQQMLSQMLDTTRNGLDETRRTLSALRATPLEEMGLVLALRALAEDFTDRNSLQLAFYAPDALDDLSTEVEHVYYRVAQEASENVAKHAKARLLTVKLEQNSNYLSMVVSDDGSGFDPDQNLKGTQLGLQGIQERAELIGADLLIKSESQKGKPPGFGPGARGPFGGRWPRSRGQHMGGAGIRPRSKPARRAQIRNRRCAHRP